MRTVILTTFQAPLGENHVLYKDESSYEFFERFTSMGETILGRYEDLQFHISNARRSSVFLYGKNITEHEIFILRSTTLTEENKHHGYIAQALAQTISNASFVLNRSHFLQFSSEFNKLFQMQFLSKHSFPIPETFFFQSDNSSFPLSLPVIVKPTSGSHGDGIHKAETEDQIPVGSPTLVQEMLPGATDYRVLVLGGKCLGAMQRKATNGKIISNFSAGGEVSKFELNDEMEELAIGVSKLFSLEFCGVDIMKDANGGLRILEVNRFPEFKGFQLATNIHVANELVQYVISQKKVN